ncbi:hypothetical protein HK096_009379, partial [Nowakowskiella sp. JEL0078]
ISISEDKTSFSSDSKNSINEFTSTISKVARFSRFKTIITLNYRDSFFNNSSSIVSSIVFDKDDQHFATAGVAKKIKIFEYESVVKDYHELFGSGRGRGVKAPGFITRMHQGIKDEEIETEEIEDATDNEGNDGPVGEFEEAEEDTGLDRVQRFPVREINCKAKIRLAR